MKKKIVVLCLVVCLAAVAVIGGTLAYFTDKAEVTNTFTVGNVNIQLIESTYHREGNDNSGDTSIPDPQNPASGMKYVTDGHKAFTDDEIKANADKYQEYLAERGENMVPGVAAAKCPYVINTGLNDAYIRIRVLVPHDANNDYVAVEEGGVITNQWCTTSMLSGEFISGAKTGEPVINKNVVMDGKAYDEYVFVRTEPLAAGAMTEWNVWNFIGIHKDATAADIEKAINAGAMDVETGFDVHVYADAIQATGFDTAADAFEAFDSAK